MSKPGHNSKVQAGPIAGERLKSFVERIERMEEERKAISSDIRDIYAEAKGVGYDVKTVRWVVQERRVDASDRAERDTLRDVYQHALDTAVDLVRGGLSLREAGRITGTSKSSIHRALAVPSVSQPAGAKPEDGDDGITGGEDGKAEADIDAAPAVGGGEAEDGHDRFATFDARPSGEGGIEARGDARGGAQRVRCGGGGEAENADSVRLTNELPGTPFIGDDPGPIPDYLRGSRTGRGA